MTHSSGREIHPNSVAETAASPNFQVELAPGFDLIGTITDEQNKPLEDVLIEVRDQEAFPNFGHMRMREGFASAFADGMPENFKTGKDGKYLVGSLPLGRLRLAVQKEGFVTQTINVVPQVAPRGTQTLNITLATALDGGSVAGTVVDDELPLGKPPRIHIDAPGYQRGFMNDVLALAEEPEQPIKISLRPIIEEKLVSYSGMVVDSTGKGIPGVELRLIVSAQRRESPRDDFPFDWDTVREEHFEDVAGLLQLFSAITDYQGRFEFHGVQPADDIEIAYWGDSINPGRIANLELLKANEQQQLKIVAQGLGRVTGKIDGERFRNFDTIDLRQEARSYPSHTGKLSADKAAFEIVDVPSGTYELQVARWSIREDPPYEIRNDVIHRQVVEVRPAETVVVDLGGD